jgi:hypothetical protein
LGSAACPVQTPCCSGHQRVPTHPHLIPSSFLCTVAFDVVTIGAAVSRPPLCKCQRALCGGAASARPRPPSASSSPVCRSLWTPNPWSLPLIVPPCVWFLLHPRCMRCTDCMPRWTSTGRRLQRSSATLRSCSRQPTSPSASWPPLWPPRYGAALLCTAAPHSVRGRACACYGSGSVDGRSGRPRRV